MVQRPKQVPMGHGTGMNIYICRHFCILPYSSCHCRLSGPHQESPPHPLVAGTEVLIGTVRFLVRAYIYCKVARLTNEMFRFVKL